MSCVAIIFDYESPVLTINFSRNGKFLITGDEIGNLKLR